MKFKIIFKAIIFLLFLSALPQMVKAAGNDFGLGDAQTGTNLPTAVQGVSTLPGVAGVIVNSALSLIGVFFFILMVYAGIVWMKSMGSSEDVDKAKEIIQTAITGLVIVSAAYAISNFVFTNIGSGASTAPPVAPKSP